MSFREKSAWISLVTLIIVAILFLLHFPTPWTYTLSPQPNGWMFQILLLTIATFIGVEIIAHIVIAIWSPRDARTPKDERELMIELRSTRIAAFIYAVVSLGSLFVGLHMAEANVIGMAYLVLISFVASQIIKFAMRVYYYRRGF